MTQRLSRVDYVHGEILLQMEDIEEYYESTAQRLARRVLQSRHRPEIKPDRGYELVVEIREIA